MKDIEEKIKYIIENPDMLRAAGIGTWKALNGAVSEYMAYKDLKSNGFIVTRGSDATGVPDFTLTHEGKKILIEHKRASKDTYKDGSFKLEFQKSRASKGDPSSRYYSAEWCDLVSIDISEHTGIPNDKRFVWSKDLNRHKDFPEKIKALHRQSIFWYGDLEDALSEAKQLCLWEDK